MVEPSPEKPPPHPKTKGQTKQVRPRVQFCDVKVPEKELNSEEKADLQALFTKITMQIVKYWEFSRCWWLITKWF